MSKYFDLFCESVMTPTPTPYAPKESNSQFPTTIFVVFDKDKKPCFSDRGVIISAFGSASTLSNFASSLYNLVTGASEVYAIIPELYTQAVTKLDIKEYYKYIKDNGTKYDPLYNDKTENKVYDDSLADDPDFIIDGTVEGSATGTEIE